MLQRDVPTLSNTHQKAPPQYSKYFWTLYCLLVCILLIVYLVLHLDMFIKENRKYLILSYGRLDFLFGLYIVYWFVFYLLYI